MRAGLGCALENMSVLTSALDMVSQQSWERLQGCLGMGLCGGVEGGGRGSLSSVVALVVPADMGALLRPHLPFLGWDGGPCIQTRPSAPFGGRRDHVRPLPAWLLLY